MKKTITFLLFLFGYLTINSAAQSTDTKGLNDQLFDALSSFL